MELQEALDQSPAGAQPGTVVSASSCPRAAPDAASADYRLILMTGAFGSRSSGSVCRTTARRSGCSPEAHRLVQVGETLRLSLPGPSGGSARHCQQEDPLYGPTFRWRTVARAKEESSPRRTSRRPRTAVLMTAQLPAEQRGDRPHRGSRARGAIRGAKGSTLHTDAPAPGGWRVTEVGIPRRIFRRGPRLTSSRSSPRTPRCRRSQSTN